MPTVYVLTHRYRHGESTSALSTKAEAYKVAAEIVAECLPEIHDEGYRQDIAKALKAKNRRKALQLWGQYQSEFGDESIDITPCKVDDGLLRKRRPPKQGRRS